MIGSGRRKKRSILLLVLGFSLTMAPESNSGGSTPEFPSAPAGSWRPFNDLGPWNRTVTGAPLQTAGQTVNGFTTQDSSSYIQCLDEKADRSVISVGKWSIPLYFVSGGSTSGVTVGFTGETDYDAGFLSLMNPVPIPSAAVSDPGETGHYPPVLGDIVPDRDLTDAHLCIIDLDTDLEYDFWHIAKDGVAWKATIGRKIDVTGDGVLDIGSGNPYFTRGTAVPLSAGLILRNEVAAGEIRHALALSIPDACNRAGFYVWPGNQTDGTGTDVRGIPEGARLRLKWTEQEIDQKLAAGQITATGKIVAIALLRYGAFNVDNGGADHLNFYAQNFSDTTGSHNGDAGNWQGLLNLDSEGYADDIAVIRPSDFEVIRFEYGKTTEIPAVAHGGLVVAAGILGILMLGRAGHKNKSGTREGRIPH